MVIDVINEKSKQFFKSVFLAGIITKLFDVAGTMTQLFDVAQDECSVLFLWTYVVAVFSLTIWSTIFLWII